MKIIQEPLTEEAKMISKQDVKQIAQQIRKDVRIAIRNKLLPKDVKCSIRVKRFVGGQSITATVNQKDVYESVKKILETYREVRMYGEGYPDPTISCNYYVRVY